MHAVTPTCGIWHVRYFVQMMTRSLCCTVLLYSSTPRYARYEFGRSVESHATYSVTPINSVAPGHILTTCISNTGDVVFSSQFSKREAPACSDKNGDFAGNSLLIYSRKFNNKLNIWCCSHIRLGKYNYFECPVGYGTCVRRPPSVRSCGYWETQAGNLANTFLDLTRFSRSVSVI